MLYFIVNEKSRSGRGAQIWKEVQRELVKRGIHYRHYVTEHEGHATRLAVEICAKTDDDICLAVVGGDGTAGMPGNMANLMKQAQRMQHVPDVLL